MIVVDCSVVVDVLTGSRDAERLATRLGSQSLAAPVLLDIEFVSALRRMVRHGELSAERAIDALADYEAFPVERFPLADGLRRRAFSLRDSLTAYDAAYVALAESLDATLLTRDAALRRASGHDAVVELI